MRHLPALAAAVASLLTLAAAAACGGTGTASGRPTIEPATPAATAARTIVGGKPATPPGTSAAAATPYDVTSSNPPATAADISPAPPEPEATPSARASDGSVPPAEGRWIDVDVTALVVRLMDGTTVVREIAPVAVGAQIDTGEYASTQTGLFHVYNKVKDLVYDPPYQTYISDWVGFDPDKANGFHSFLKDAQGQVVDASTGRVSNGCIRTGEADAVFDFAEVGMPVYVHH